MTLLNNIQSDEERILDRTDSILSEMLCYKGCSFNYAKETFFKSYQSIYLRYQKM